MTKQHYIMRKADDLRLGNMYVHWARQEENYQAPARILGIQMTKEKKIKITLDNGFSRSFHPEHEVVIAEVA